MASAAPLLRPAAPRLRLRATGRNMLRGIVTAIVHGPINAEVGLLVGDRIVIDALVTNACIDALDLHPGDAAVALVNPSFVTLLDDTPGLGIPAPALGDQPGGGEVILHRYVIEGDKVSNA